MPAFARAADGGRRPGRPWPARPRAYRPAPDEAPPDPDGTQAEITLGACVRVSLSGARARSQMVEEGVVIEVVAPDAEVQSARVVRLVTPIADEPRYVIQCWSRRVLRQASGLVVVAL